MSKQLYEEALADVKKLKEIAEDNAKKALLEAVTPRIKDLIEHQLMGEAVANDERLLFDDPSMDQDSSELTSALDNTTHAHAPLDTDLDVEEAKQADTSVNDTDDQVVSQEGAAANIQGESNSDEYELSMESVDSLRVMLDQNADVSMSKKIAGLEKRIRSITEASLAIKVTPSYSKLIESIISEVEDMYSYLQDKMQMSSDKKTYEMTLENHYSTLKQLMEQNMHKKNSTLTEADVTLKLTGLPDEIDLDSVGVDLVSGDEDAESEEDLDLSAEEESDEEESEEEESEEDLELESSEGDDDVEGDDTKMEARHLSDDTIVEIDEAMLRREIKKMKALREAEETKVQSWGHGPGDVSSEFSDEDMGDPLKDVELTTEGDSDAADEDELEEAQSQEDKHGASKDQDENLDEMQDDDDLDEAYMDEAEDDRKHGGNVAPSSMGPGAESSKQKRHTETLRRRLESEVRLQSEAKTRAMKAKRAQKEAQKKAQQSKKMQEKQAAKKQAKKMQEAYAFYATKFNESVARSNKLRDMLTEVANKGSVENDGTTRSAEETSSLRKKLAETNLFNTKLLFTNKLLQNESLTRRQKAEVIERLDEAKTEREVKLVYESLVKTLQGSSTRRVTESSAPTSVIGSSSRPVRPSSTLNEGFEADRWARLAGIVK